MLKSIKHRQPYALKALAMLLALYMLSCLSCGKRMPPQPPVERVPQKVQIDGVQRGDTVLLNWTMPARNASDGSVLNIDRVDIYRYAEASSTKFSLTEQEFESQSTLISSIKFAKEDFGLKKQTYSDRLEFAGQPIRLIYAVRFVNSSGQKAAFSNFLLVESTSKVAKAPENAVAQTSEEAIILSWLAPTSNVDESSPVNIVGYNVYRKNEASGAFKLVNSTPINDARFLDQKFQFGIDYEYFVRTISLGVDGETVESLDSGIITITPIDNFPPSPPSSITIAAAPNNLSIFFATNPEKDIVGYRVYRSTDPNLELSSWTLMTPEILSSNTFQDKKVESGKTYYYYLTATDSAGNVSENRDPAWCAARTSSSSARDWRCPSAAAAARCSPFDRPARRSCRPARTLRVSAGSRGKEPAVARTCAPATRQGRRPDIRGPARSLARSRSCLPRRAPIRFRSGPPQAARAPGCWRSSRGPEPEIREHGLGSCAIDAESSPARCPRPQAGIPACAELALHQDDVVLLLRVDRLDLQRDRLADEVAEHARGSAIPRRETCRSPAARRGCGTRARRTGALRAGSRAASRSRRSARS